MNPKDYVSNEVDTRISTTFFLRLNKKSFLFCAAHSFLGVKFNGELDKNSPNTFYLKIPKARLNNDVELSIKVNEVVYFRVDTNFLKYHYDFVCLPINVGDFPIVSIENFDTINAASQGSIREGFFYAFAPKQGGSLTKSTIDYSTLKEVYLSDGELVYHMYSTKDALSSGGAGSPLFLKTENSKIIFGGMIAAVTANEIFVIPPDAIYKIFK